MKAHILDEEIFPIVGWAGPGGDLLRDEVMASMAEAGFTVSHSSPHPDPAAVEKALDLAHKHRVRLLLVHSAWHVGDDFKLNAARKKEITRLVERVRQHPGLYGYHLRDEPAFGLLPVLAEVSDHIRQLDPYHLISLPDTF